MGTSAKLGEEMWAINIRPRCSTRWRDFKLTSKVVADPSGAPLSCVTQWLGLASPLKNYTARKLSFRGNVIDDND